MLNNLQLAQPEQRIERKTIGRATSTKDFHRPKRLLLRVFFSTQQRGKFSLFTQSPGKCLFYSRNIIFQKKKKHHEIHNTSDKGSVFFQLWQLPCR